jgi:hypothetical protein
VDTSGSIDEKLLRRFSECDFAEVLFAFCRKMTEGTLEAATHKRSVDDLRHNFQPKLLPPSMGDDA